MLTRSFLVPIPLRQASLQPLASDPANGQPRKNNLSKVRAQLRHSSFALVTNSLSKGIISDTKWWKPELDQELYEVISRCPYMLASPQGLWPVCVSSSRNVGHNQRSQLTMFTSTPSHFSVAQVCAPSVLKLECYVLAPQQSNNCSTSPVDLPP